ncbi:squalene/phytoene synthase family protein [Bradymonas sediminis]|uniref:Uncharacterized protein n=1 Tax=Bradymonas sediminis TaxID=1548548 RepID=A0A2Z4FIF2_9DELT|nr:squalene/phytoene synthase family protein [Bradymonas sediminis]AWV88468.1 hypothetical protein DN745_03535 [Bradymonas sediminis]TDP77596.1 farnesyl-diphosphate farnesyltransferase [Bradymonas sediminis]
MSYSASTADASVHVPPPRADIEPPAPAAHCPDLGAWAFCWRSLVEVSRTFSKPIEMLSPNLRAATACGYLICRIADTIEDDETLSNRERDALFAAMLEVLEDGAAPDTFIQLAAGLSGRPCELRLARNIDQVMRVFRALAPQHQKVCVTWAGEMIRGMGLYARREPGEDGLVLLRTLSDLERYCYFVAGTVGQMLTGLFLAEMPDISQARIRQMRANAEDFGLGLQLVNILKDQTEDLGRGWCFIPQTLWDTQEMEPRDMLDPAMRSSAHQTVAPVFERAHHCLFNALEFTLGIPPEQVEMRLFCILPLWMAARTLRHARGNDAMFIADAPVKISRAEVTELIAQALESAGDDPALRAQFAALIDA